MSGSSVMTTGHDRTLAWRSKLPPGAAAPCLKVWGAAALPMAALAWVAATTSPRSSAHMQEQWCCPQLGLVRTHHDALDVQHRPGRGAALPGGPRRHCRVLLPRAAVRRRAHRFGASRSSHFAPLADKRLRYTASAPKHGTTLWRKGPDRRARCPKSADPGLLRAASDLL